MRFDFRIPWNRSSSVPYLFMAPKKSNPIEEPPVVSSEEEEEGTTNEDEEKEEDPQEESIKLSSPPTQQAQKQTAVKKPEIPPATLKSKSSTSEESGSESESEATPRPIATKPMEEMSKATKPREKDNHRELHWKQEGNKGNA